MYKSNLFCPSIPFEWTERVKEKLKDHNVKISPSILVILFTIFRECRMRKKVSGLSISHSSYDHFFITRQAANRVLIQLEQSAVIHLTKEKGRSPLIDLLIIPIPLTTRTGTLVQKRKDN